MEQEIIILGVGNPYSIPGENGRPDVEGCAMYYIPANNMEMAYDMESNVVGYLPIKETMPTSFHEQAKIHGVPCKAKATYVMRVTQGKQVLKIASVELMTTDLTTKEKVK